MNIFVIAGLAISVTAIISVLKEIKPEFTLIISTVFGIIILSSLYSPIKDIISSMYTVAQQTGIKNEIMSPVIKITGISIIAEFAASICTDAGQSNIATKVESAGKITVLAISVPIITQILDTVLNLLN